MNIKETIEWHSTRISMPDSDITVLLFCPQLDCEVWIGYHDGEVWREVGSDTIDGRVTHWAHIPSGPRHSKAVKRELAKEGV